MTLSKQADYALRVLLYAAAHPDRPVTIAEIAEFHLISANHLTVVVHHLGQAGWLATQRGRGGGLRLALPPHQIGLGQVLREAEPGFTLVECFGANSRCPLTSRCGLERVLHEGLDAMFSVFDRYTLADLASWDNKLLHP